MNDTPNEDSIDDTNRKSIYQWNNPTFDLSNRRLYNPLVWPFVLIDLLILTRWWFWHKLQGFKADRQRIHTEIVLSLQSGSLIEDDENLTPHQKEQIKRTQDGLERVADELNLQSDQLDRYTNTGTDRSTDTDTTFDTEN